jgi:hypothetical protein
MKTRIAPSNRAVFVPSNDTFPQGPGVVPPSQHCGSREQGWRARGTGAQGEDSQSARLENSARIKERSNSQRRQARQDRDAELR